MMRLAWYVHAVYSKKIKWEKADPELIWWINNDEDDPHDLFVPRLHVFGDAGVGQLAE